MVTGENALGESATCIVVSCMCSPCYSIILVDAPDTVALRFVCLLPLSIGLNRFIFWESSDSALLVLNY